jgi:hypothetical protein|tara:strand:- start:322 stop:615 length:294 start_codon:yes stop_codon:yes gene_type:complete
MLAKNKPGRSGAYLDFIRSRPCWVCQSKPVHPHHTVRGGVGLKGSDFSAIPLCPKHHRELHDKGIRTFESNNKVCIATITATHTIAWLDLNYADKEG